MQDYIYSMEEQEIFPVLKKLQLAKGTEKMPPPNNAAKIFCAALINCSGSRSHFTMLLEEFSKRLNPIGIV